MSTWRIVATIGVAHLSLAVASGQEKEADAKRETRTGGAFLDEVRAHKEGLALWWTGHNGWLIKADGLLVGTDLVIDDPGRETRSPVSAAEIGPELDVSIVTHGHGDHFNGPTSRALVAKSKCLFVLPRSCLETAKRYGIPEERIVVAKPREPMEVKGIRIEPLRAIHGNRKGAVYWDANLDDCGYVIRMKGKSIMQPGDSVLLEDHLFVKHVDVLLFSPTEHNMQVENSVTLINELEPEYVLPQHRNTYPIREATRFWTNAYHIEVRARLSKDLQKRYHILEMGARLDVAP